MRHAVILAGGSGTRLWPASRRTRPKQFLAFEPGGETLLASAIRRASLVADGGITIVTAAAHVAQTREVIDSLPALIEPDTFRTNLAGGSQTQSATRSSTPVRKEGVLGGEKSTPVRKEGGPGGEKSTPVRIEVLAEPCARNTAAAIGLAAAAIERRDPEAVLIVLPADQRVADAAGFARAVAAGLVAVERDDVIGTIGIVPTRAETGFGYLEVAEARVEEVTPVLRFVEKPDRETAQRYVEAGTYLWNAGMFLVSARRVMAELDAHLEGTGDAVRAIAAGRVRAEDVYPGLASVSFDHAVMERTSRVVTVPAAIGWDDVGSWAAVAELAELAELAESSGVQLESKGTYISCDDGTLVVALGVEDLVIVKAGNAILVASKQASQDVRKVIAELERRNLDEFL